MFDFTFTTPISLLISLSALAGVTVHDTKIDKLTVSMAATVPAVMAMSEVHKFSTDPHTHVEKVNVEKNSQPRIMPRGDRKKHLMQKNVPKGVHNFDGYTLPVA